MKHKELEALEKIKAQSIEQLDELHKQFMNSTKSNDLKEKEKQGTLLNFYNQIYQRVFAITAQEMNQKNIEKDIELKLKK